MHFDLYINNPIPFYSYFASILILCFNYIYKLLLKTIYLIMVAPLVFLESVSLRVTSTMTHQSTLAILSLSKACETGTWRMNIILYIALLSILHLKVTLVLTSLNALLNSLSPVAAVIFNLLLDQSL